MDIIFMHFPIVSIRFEYIVNYPIKMRIMITNIVLLVATIITITFTITIVVIGIIARIILQIV